MRIEYTTDEQGYIEYLVNFSQVTSIGKGNRKRYYIGFSFIYFLIWIAIFYYVVVNGQIPVPYFYMSIIIYIIAFFNMKYLDVHSIGAKKRAIRDIASRRIILNEKIRIEFSEESILTTQATNTVQYKVKNILGYTKTDNYIVLYITEIKAFVMPKTKVSSELSEYLETMISRIEG